LAYESSLFDNTVKQALRDKLETSSNLLADVDAQVSLIILYLLDDLTDLAKLHLEELMKSNPREPKLFILRAATLLNERGLKRSRLSAVEEAVSLINLAAATGGENTANDVAEITNLIHNGYYKKNSINPNSKLSGLLEKVGVRDPKVDSILSSIIDR
tara:strand:+ start:208 stop:681 length:474 start_codon:yes stop_codon:yes gene_type:complete